MPPYNILHTEWSDGWGGQEIRILAESKALLKMGLKVTIACQPHGQLFQRAQESGVEVVPLNMKKGIDLAAFYRCRHILKRLKIDLVHTHSSVDAWVCGAAAKSMGLPVVRSRHLSTPIRKGAASNFVYMKLADMVITSSRSIRENMIKINGMRPEKIVAVPAGIDEKQFSLSRVSGDVRNELGIEDRAFVVGIVAVLRSWKGHLYLIEAVKRLLPLIPDLKLLIVGEGPMRSLIEEAVQEMPHGSVFMTGYRQDVPECIKAMDCVVLPSYKNEATSQVLPQAMAMERPVIASNAGGLSEVVIHEKTGLLVPPKDSSAIAEAIMRYYQNPGEAKRIAAAGREHCLRYFTFSRMINETVKVYEKVREGRE